jgi:hypothetical protein
VVASSPNARSFLAILFLAGFVASAAIAVSNSLNVASFLRSQPKLPDAGLPGRLDSLAASIADLPDPVSADQDSVEALRKTAADEASRLCAIRDRSASLLGDTGALLRLGSPVLAAAREAADSLDRACALSGQFGYDSGFDSLVVARAVLEARRAEAIAGVEKCAARVGSALADRVTAKPALAGSLLGLLAGVIAAAGSAAGILAYCTVPVSSSRPRVPASDATHSRAPAGVSDGLSRNAVSGYARDFANEITIIGGYNEILLESLPADHPNRQDLEEARLAVARAERTVRELLERTPEAATLKHPPRK